jgi:hypothetical protein
MTDTTLKLIPLLAAVNAHLRAAVPGDILHAADHERFTSATPRPAALTEIADIALIDPRGDDGTERLCVTLSLSTFVIYTSQGDERENRLACKALALRLAHRLRYHALAGQPVSQPVVTDIATDYLDATGDNAAGANNAALVECQRLDWELQGYVGADIWDAAPIAETIILGAPQVTDEYPVGV